MLIQTTHKKYECPVDGSHCVIENIVPLHLPDRDVTAHIDDSDLTEIKFEARDRSGWALILLTKSIFNN